MGPGVPFIGNAFLMRRPSLHHVLVDNLSLSFDKCFLQRVLLRHYVEDVSPAHAVLDMSVVASTARSPFHRCAVSIVRIVQGAPVHF